MSNLRAQIGFFDIPFHVRCPKCHSTIYGKVFVEDNNINVENADIVQCDDEEFYSVELSAEFPTRKATHKKIYEVELSPYMRNLLLYGSNEKAIEETQKTMYFANFVKSGLSEMKQNFELFWNNQDKILFARVTDMIKQYPEYITEFITNSNFDDESKIIKLNELLDSGNYLAANTVLKTIEYTIDIETYIYKFSKAFALKTRRKELSFEQILDKYK